LATQESAYADLLRHSLNFANRAQALRQTMERRSGIFEGVDVALRLQKSLDPMALYDWVSPDFNAKTSNQTNQGVIRRPDGSCHFVVRPRET
jgi:hypothetical protein